MPTGQELDAKYGSNGAAPEQDVFALPQMPTFDILHDAGGAVTRIPETELAETIDGLASLSLADAIFAAAEPRAQATLRGVAVECTTLTPAQVQYIQKHCYAPAKKGQEPQARMDVLVPVVLVFGLRVPGTDTAVFTMKQVPQVAKLSEGVGLMSTIFDLTGLTKKAQDDIVGNSGPADTAG